MDRARLEAAGTEYVHLRGLIFVPLGALMVVAALGNWEWGPWKNSWMVLGCAVVLMLLTLPIRRHYDDRFGRVTLSGRQVMVVAAATAGTVVVTVAAYLLLRSSAGWSLDLPVNGLAAALAASFLAYHIATVGPKPHHLVIWGPVLFVGLLPVWGGLNLADTSNLALVIVGVAAMVCGIVDDRYLRRSLGSPGGLESAAIGRG